MPNIAPNRLLVAVGLLGACDVLSPVVLDEDPSASGGGSGGALRGGGTRGTGDNGVDRGGSGDGCGCAIDCGGCTCLSAAITCDGVTDCPDGQDEEGCTSASSGACVNDPAVTSQGVASVTQQADFCFSAAINACFTCPVGEVYEATEDCLKEEVGLGGLCADCFVAYYQCLVDQCLDECSDGGADCETCRYTWCVPPFDQCSGLDLGGGGGA